MVWKSEYAPPYSSGLATIRSPLSASVVTTAWMAAMPLANAYADSVPSNSAMARSNASTVGLP